MFVYLDIFLQLDFVSMNISHFFKLLLYLINIALRRHFTGHMKILASMLYHKSHYSESHYQHSSSNAIGLQKISFSLTMFFFLIKASISDAPQYSFFCLVVWLQYHFDTITCFSTVSYLSIQRHPLVFQTNGCLNFQKHWSIIS